MIILTFVDEHIPDFVYVDSERLSVKPYKPKPLQCFNCFGYGHSSRVCLKQKLCGSCSLQEHGDCSRTVKCINCKKDHNARDKNCQLYKSEEEAVLKSHADHISIGHAKKLLSKAKFSDVVKANSKPTHVGIPPNDRLPTSNLKGKDKKSLNASSVEVPEPPSVKGSHAPSGGGSRSSSGTPLAPPVVGSPALSGGASSISAEISVAPAGASHVSLGGASWATLETLMATSGASLDEASQAISLPDIEVSPGEGLQTGIAPVEVHVQHNSDDMEFDVGRGKKRRNSHSPPASPDNKGKAKIPDDKGEGKSSKGLPSKKQTHKVSASKEVSSRKKEKSKVPSLTRSVGKNTGEPAKKSSKS